LEGEQKSEQLLDTEHCHKENRKHVFSPVRSVADPDNSVPGSRSDFPKRLDPEPDITKLLANCALQILYETKMKQIFTTFVAKIYTHKKFLT
jgi:hypothetical protein